MVTINVLPKCGAPARPHLYDPKTEACAECGVALPGIAGMKVTSATQEGVKVRRPLPPHRGGGNTGFRSKPRTGRSKRS